MKVLKFGAIWCSGCLVMKPRWAKIEKEHTWLETEYYDADENSDKFEEFSVSDYPTFIFLDKDNNEIERLVGEISEKELIKKINKYKEM